MQVIHIDVHTPLPNEAGGKALGLQRIMAAGLPVPAAWAVLPGASLSELAEEIRRRNIPLLAVRSSAADEDSERHSFAGIHESRLAVPARDLPEAVDAVSRSTLSPRAASYREETGLPPATGPCAVVVQEMIPGECSGIAFGGGPGSGRVAVEAVEGLGETAVDGRATPETLSLRSVKGKWNIERRTRRSQPVALAVRETGVHACEVPESRRNESVLDAATAGDIAGGVARLESAAGKPLDVEWTFAAGRLWYLQARPQSRPLDDALPAGEVWTRTNAREVLPDIPSAFCRSTFIKPFDGAERASLRSYGISLDASIPAAAFVYGRPVFNERVFTVADLLGISRDYIQAEFGGTAPAEPEVRPMDWRKVLRHPGIMARALWTALKTEKQARRFISVLGAYTRNIESTDISAMDSEDLLTVLDMVSDRILQPFVLNAVRIAGTAGNPQYHILSRLQKMDLPDASPWSMLSRLAYGGEPSVSTMQIHDLVSLAKTMSGWSGCMEFTSRILPEHAASGYWKERLPSDIWRRVEGWLDRYGHRGPYETDLARPRYRDDLRILARALFPLVPEEAREEAASRAGQSREESEQAWEAVSRRCGPLERRLLRVRIREFKKLLALREYHRSAAMRALFPVRNMLLELGRRLEAEHRLKSRNDIWHLSIEEIMRAFRNPAPDMNVAVAREHARLSAWRRISVPNRFSSEDIPSMARPGEPETDGATVFRGNGVSPGMVVGKVAVLRSPDENPHFPTGAILVAPATDPAWTPVFARALGVIVELGGALSHAGIVAREYGIPCVANIPDIAGILQDGDTVHLDGSSGVVRRIREA